MSIISNIYASIPAAPAGGTRQVLISRDFTNGYDDIEITTIYTFSDTAKLTYVNRYRIAATVNDITGVLQDYCAVVTSTYNLFTA